MRVLTEFCHPFHQLADRLRVDYINESPIMKTRKPYYNTLLDDRAGLQEAFGVLDVLIYRIKNKHANIKFNKTREG